MKTFFERFVDEVVRKKDAGEIDETKAQRWIAEIQQRLEEHARHEPNAPHRTNAGETLTVCACFLSFWSRYSFSYLSAVVEIILPDAAGAWSPLPG